MKPKSVVEIILLPHIAMVVSKQHHRVTETLPTSIKYIAKKQTQRLVDDVCKVFHLQVMCKVVLHCYHKCSKIAYGCIQIRCSNQAALTMLSVLCWASACYLHVLQCRTYSTFSPLSVSAACCHMHGVMQTCTMQACVLNNAIVSDTQHLKLSISVAAVW